MNGKGYLLPFADAAHPQKVAGTLCRCALPTPRSSWLLLRIRV